MTQKKIVKTTAKIFCSNCHNEIEDGICSSCGNPFEHGSRVYCGDTEHYCEECCEECDAEEGF